MEEGNGGVVVGRRWSTSVREAGRANGQRRGTSGLEAEITVLVVQSNYEAVAVVVLVPSERGLGRRERVVVLLVVEGQGCTESGGNESGNVMRTGHVVSVEVGGRECRRGS